MAKRVTVKELTGCTPQEINFVIEYTIDWNARRAAKASGYHPDMGYKLRERDHIEAAIKTVLLNRMDAASIDAEWVLLAAYDNYKIALSAGNITAANTALSIIAKHSAVDAFAAEKLMLVDDSEIKARLDRGRDRVAKLNQPDEVSFMS